MEKKNALLAGMVWLLTAVCIAASAFTLLSAKDGTIGRRWISGDDYALLERYRRLEAVRTSLEENYYQEVDDETLMNGAIKGMMASLQDPYTYYYTPEEMQKANAQSDGKYIGIGVLLQYNADGEIEILRVYENGPAFQSGLQVGDRILRVDGVSVSGENMQTFNAALELMRGGEGEQLCLHIRRDAIEKDVTVAYGDVQISNVQACMLEGGIGYIEIFQFSGDDVTAFTEALAGLEADGARALIVDLRNNPGGLLDHVQLIADALLPEGLIVYTEDRQGKRENLYSDAACCDLPLAVLINGMSASASEILAAAVQDYGRGTIVGTRSYGKGVVQTLEEFASDGAGMKYTSSCYYTPKGNSIHGIGVTPDVIVEATANDYFGAADVENDVQLQQAIKILLEAQTQE